MFRVADERGIIFRYAVNALYYTIDKRAVHSERHGAGTGGGQAGSQSAVAAAAARLGSARRQVRHKLITITGKAYQLRCTTAATRDALNS
jgi:hypothetical protein